MNDELAIRRFDKAEWSKEISPQDCLKYVLHDIDNEKIKSIMVIAVTEDSKQVAYYAGPDTATYRKIWHVLQEECLRVLERMMTNDE